MLFRQFSMQRCLLKLEKYLTQSFWNYKNVCKQGTEVSNLGFVVARIWKLRSVSSRFYRSTMQLSKVPPPRSCFQSLATRTRRTAKPILPAKSSSHSNAQLSDTLRSKGTVLLASAVLLVQASPILAADNKDPEEEVTSPYLLQSSIPFGVDESRGYVGKQSPLPSFKRCLWTFRRAPK